MADPVGTPSLPLNGQRLSVTLPHKPTASLSCMFVPGNDSPLVVFLNGLGLPQSHWWPVIERFPFLRSPFILPTHKIAEDAPSFLTYDRYGQGLTTSPDPQDDVSDLPPGHRHDLISVVHDLHVLIETITEKYHKYTLLDTRLVFVANSIGCAIARYYAQQYPGRVAALLLLDSYMTNTNFVDLYPDPEAPDYDESKLPDGITTADIIAAREGMGKLFRPDVTNKEGFWRGNITSLLPEPGSPKLMGYGKLGGPGLTVVGHDPEIFAEESLRMKGMTRAVAMNYTNPAWDKYNKELVHITDDKTAKAIIAKGAGHFIQQGRPDLIADELHELVDKV